jgi:hypothetical protein
MSVGPSWTDVPLREGLVVIEPWQGPADAELSGPAENSNGEDGKAQRQLYKLVDQAYNAVHALPVDLHDLSCPGGVYREPEALIACGPVRSWKNMMPSRRRASHYAHLGGVIVCSTMPS